MDASADLLPGTPDLLILKAVSLGKLHGYAVLFRIQQSPAERSSSARGAYPALYRLERQALIEANGAPPRQPAREVLSADGRRTRAPG